MHTIRSSWSNRSRGRLRKVPVLEHEGSTVGEVSVEYTRCTVQSKPIFPPFNVSSLADLRVQDGLVN